MVERTLQLREWGCGVAQTVQYANGVFTTPSRTSRSHTARFCQLGIECQHPPVHGMPTEGGVRKGNERSGTRTWFCEQLDGPFASRRDGVCLTRPWRRRPEGVPARGVLGLPGNGPPATGAARRRFVLVLQLSTDNKMGGVRHLRFDRSQSSTSGYR